MTDIHANVEAVNERIIQACQRSGRSPDEIITVAVSKFVRPELISAALQSRITHFGENRVQEAETKIKGLSHLEPSPTWHMVGHLQTNKVNMALDIFDIIQSIDSTKLAEAISRRARKSIPIFLEVNISGEASKYGFSIDSIESSLEEIAKLPNVEVKGLMTVAPLVDNVEMVRSVFQKLRSLRDFLGLEYLSMGMTDDFEVAIEEGATHIRIGRAIFGERQY